MGRVVLRMRPVLALVLALALVLPTAVATLAPAECVSPCGGIHPGGALVLGGVLGPSPYCTMGFIVTDGTDLYVTTAGHCVNSTEPVPHVGERVEALGVPGTFGTVAYEWCELPQTGTPCFTGHDFGMIKIDSDKRAYVSLAMPKFGAAAGMFTQHDTDPLPVEFFGWSPGPGDVGGVLGAPTGNPATQARVGVAINTHTAANAQILTAAAPGDSGSAVLIVPCVGCAPEALGSLVSVSSTTNVQRLDGSLAHASAELGRAFWLVTSL